MTETIHAPGWVPDIDRGPLPDGVVRNDGESDVAVVARYLADYHNADADKVNADLAAWLAHLGPTRPAAIPHAPLPAFDKPDPSYGSVATTLPADHPFSTGADPLVMRADFNGVLLDVNRWGGAPPMLKGANSTPFGNTTQISTAMLMQPMLILYERKWQDAHLTEAAERNLSHFVFSAGAWNDAANGRQFSPADVVAWAQYVRSWGFYATYWGAVPTMDDPYLIALVNAHAIDMHINGEEVDGRMTKEQYDAVLQNNLAIHGSGVPTCAHFTADYPEGFPRDTFLIDWSKYNGKVHLAWQANPEHSAGHQAAMLWYARARVNLGMIGGNGQLAPDSRVYAFETMAESQLYGKCDEVTGNLRTWELLCAPTGGRAGMRPVAGFGNGCRYPDGRPL